MVSPICKYPIRKYAEVFYKRAKISRRIAHKTQTNMPLTNNPANYLKVFLLRWCFEQPLIWFNITQCKINSQRTKQVKNISFQSVMEDYFLFSAVKWKTLRKLVHLRLLPSTYINTSMHPLVFLSLNHFYNTINSCLN